jgi:copper(I)-binding protein
MSIGKTRICGIALAALVASSSFAAAQKLVAPGQEPFKAASAMLAIKSPSVNACPAQAKVTGWIMTNKPGAVSYMIARKGGGVSGPHQAQAVPSAKGAMATFSRTMTIHNAIDAEYRILVADGTGKVMSNWAPLRASCKIKLGG